MTTPLFTAGSRILAATLDQIAPLSAVKTSDESVTSSTALQNDNQLYVPLAANAYYAFECYLDDEGGTKYALCREACHATDHQHHHDH